MRKWWIFFFTSFLSMTTISQNNLSPNLTFFYDPEVFLNYKKIGVGDKPIIFLHGFGLSLFSWNEVETHIDTTKYSLYLIDLKGFGFSYNEPKGSYSIETQSKIIAEFIKKLSLTNVTLVGHSYGGVIALYLLFINGSKNLGINFQKLILLDTPAFIDAQPFFLKVLRNPILNFISLKVLSPKSNAIFTIRNTFYKKKEGLRKYLELYTFFFAQEGHDKTMTLIAKQIYPDNITEITNFYHSIEIPTLIIWGENDRLIPLKFGEKLKAEIKNATLKIINQCGHVPNEERPDETAFLINDFLMK